LARWAVQRFLIKPNRKVATASTKKMKKRVLAMLTAPAAMTAKAKQGGNQRDDKEDNSVVQHVSFLVNRPMAW